VSREEAYQQVGTKAVTGSESGLKNRGRFYLYTRQNGLWTKEVAGLDPVKERDKLDPYCPVRNVTPQFPPTLLVHGTDDTDVPYEQSRAMAKELARQADHRARRRSRPVRRRPAARDRGQRPGPAFHPPVS
jgi:acetyl esterase/lipase